MTKRILLVDDNELVGISVTGFLEMLGYEVHYVTSGDDALQLAARLQQEGRAVHMGISDVRMPDMDGMVLSRELYRLYQLPILLISGYPLEAKDMQTTDTDIRGLLYKPFRLDEFEEQVQAILLAGSQP